MAKVMKPAVFGCACFLLLGAPGQASAADTLEIRNFVGTINWSNGPMSVDIEKNAGDTEVSGRKSMTVDGGVERIDSSDCKSSYGNYDIDWFGKKKKGRFGGYKNLEDMPVLNITVPKGVTLKLRNSAVFTDGQPDVFEADIELRHCGSVTLGDVENTLALDSRGSADLTVGQTGQIVASLKGSGDLTGENSGDVLIKSHGSGDIELGDVTSLEASVHGSGDVSVEDIDGDVDLSSHGSGDIDLGDVTGSLEYSGHGSGDFEISSLTARQAKVSSSGSGDIDIDGGDVTNLEMIANGSASLEFSGTAQDAILRASGSGDIYVDRVTDSVEIKTSGSGDVEVDARG